jgi:RHS repeat-associated protein
LPWATTTSDHPEAQNKKYNGKEFVEMHGLDEYDSEARWMYPSILRTTTIDPLAEKYYSISPYAWCGNNPVNIIDPTGMFGEAITSTHTDKYGNVVAVYNDGDFGVYQHNGDTEETKKELEEKYSSKNTSGGGKWRGETEYWDEFVDRYHNGLLKKNTDGSYQAYGKVLFDQSWDYEIEAYFMYSNEYSGLSDLALGSQPKGFYDIKSGYKNGTGKKLNGKYATAESAGNFLAGLNAAHRVGFDFYIRLAGALHVGGMKAVTTSLLTGKQYGQYPWYGEINYCTRRVMEGWLTNRRANDRSIVLQRFRLTYITQ